MDIFLNELSINSPAPSIREAIRRLNAFGRIVKEISTYIDGVRTPENFASIELGPEFRLADWLHSYDSETQDLKSLILTKVGTSPYLEGFLDNVSNEKLIEFAYEENTCLGLGLASSLMFNTLSVSFDVDLWNNEEIEISAVVYNGSEIETSNLVVRHVSKLEHINFYTEWLKTVSTPTVKSGRQLWLKRNELFPSLIFCESVRNQINWLNEGNPEFFQILDRLTELDRYCKNWPNNSPFDTSRFESKITPESSTRLKDFKEELTVLCPDGNYRLFSWHARFTPGAGRIHFWEIISERKLIIGSIANQNYIK